MNSEIQKRCPMPLKTADHILFKKFATSEKTHSFLQHSHSIIADLSKLRGKSQNPQEKDDSFKKTQSDLPSYDDLFDSWDALEEISSV